MTLRKIAAVLVWISVCTGFFACNSKYEAESISLASSAVVSSFKIGSDDSLLANIDSVFFSIDLVKGEIFNADSLPYGTRITKLVPVITTLETAALLELKVHRSNGTDTVYDYFSETTDSIDFTNPVTIRVVSANGDHERNYQVRVNVHQVKSDSLMWTNISTAGLPSTLTEPTAQCTMRRGDNFYCLTTDGSAWSLAVNTVGLTGLNGATMPATAWEASDLQLPFTPRINTFAANDNALFILADDNTLWTSEDDGTTWTSTSMKWEYIYGGHRNQLIGNFKDESGNYKLQYYPSGTITALPQGMPVSGTSVPVLYNFPMSQRPQSIIVGGRKADGTLSASTWGFDGDSWLKISKRELPVGIEKASVAPYLSFTVSAGWTVTEWSTMFVMGGCDTEGSPNTTVYMSTDYGYHWTTADDHLQLPDDHNAFTDAQAYVMSSLYKADVTPMIVKPLEQWECPFIYLFGGIGNDGVLSPVIWRGVVNRLTFKPIE